MLISVLGAPLVGKRTLVAHLARSWPGVLQRYELPVELAGGSTPASLLACSLQESGRHVDVWCLPGGIAAEWPLDLARRSQVAVLVLDPQINYAEQQRQFADLYLRELSLAWCVVVGKQDFVGVPHIPTADPVPEVLRGAPLLRYADQEPNAGARVRSFFAEHVLPRAGDDEGLRLANLLSAWGGPRHAGESR